jgi:hypothetical protein
MAKNPSDATLAKRRKRATELLNEPKQRTTASGRVYYEENDSVLADRRQRSTALLREQQENRAYGQAGRGITEEDQSSVNQALAQSKARDDAKLKQEREEKGATGIYAGNSALNRWNNVKGSIKKGATSGYRDSKYYENWLANNGETYQTALQTGQEAIAELEAEEKTTKDNRRLAQLQKMRHDIDQEVRGMTQELREIGESFERSTLYDIKGELSGTSGRDAYKQQKENEELATPEQRQARRDYLTRSVSNAEKTLDQIEQEEQIDRDAYALDDANSTERDPNRKTPEQYANEKAYYARVIKENKERLEDLDARDSEKTPEEQQAALDQEDKEKYGDYNTETYAGISSSLQESDAKIANLKRRATVTDQEAMWLADGYNVPDEERDPAVEARLTALRSGYWDTQLAREMQINYNLRALQTGSAKAGEAKVAFAGGHQAISEDGKALEGVDPIYTYLNGSADDKKQIEAGQHQSQLNAGEEAGQANMFIAPDVETLLRLDTMTQEEKDVFNYFYTRGRQEEAQEYFNSIAHTLDQRRQQQVFAKWKELAQSGMGGRAASIFGSLFNDVFIKPVQGLAGGVRRAGENVGLVEEQPYNPYSLDKEAYFANQGAMAGLTAGLSDTDKQIFQTVYSLMKNAATNAMRAGIPIYSAIAPVATGAGIYFDTENQYMLQGADRNKAAMAGILNGFAESLFEEISFGNLQRVEDAISTLYKSGGSWLKKTGAGALQALVEGSEEMFTEVANIFTDIYIVGDGGDYAQAIQNYHAQGMTLKDAKKQAYYDAVAQTLEAGLAGAVSGLVFGSIPILRTEAGNEARFLRGGGINTQNTVNLEPYIQQQTAEIGGMMQEAGYDGESAALFQEMFAEAISTGTVSDIAAEIIKGDPTASQILSTLTLSDINANSTNEQVREALANVSPFRSPRTGIETEAPMAGRATQEYAENTPLESVIELGEQNIEQDATRAQGAQELAEIMQNGSLLNLLALENTVTEQTQTTDFRSVMPETLQGVSSEPVSASVADALTAIYEEGVAGVPMGTYTRGAGISQELAQQAYDLGSTATRTTSPQSTTQGRVSYDVSDQSILAPLKNQLAVVEAYAKQGNTDIVISDSLGEGVEGLYSPDANTIYLSPQADISYVFGHELVHSIKDRSPKLYESLKNSFLEYANNTEGYNLQERSNTLKTAISQAQDGREVTLDEVTDELIARTFAGSAIDQQMIETIVKTDKTLAQRISDFFSELLERIKNIINERILNKDQEAKLGQTEEALQKGVDTIQTLLKEEQSNRRETPVRQETRASRETTTETETETRQSLDIEADLQALQQEVEDRDAYIQSIQDYIDTSDMRRVNENAVRDIARALKQEYGTNITIKSLTEQLTQAFTEIRQNNELTQEWIEEVLTPIAQRVIDGATYLDTSLAEEHRGARDYLKKTKMYVPASVSEDIGGYGAFRRGAGKGLNLTQQTGAIAIDTVYQEMQSEYGMSEIFPELFNEAEMLYVMGSFLNETNPRRSSVYDGIDADVVTKDLVIDMINAYFEVPNKLTKTDRKIEQLGKHLRTARERSEALQEKYQARIDKMKEQNTLASRQRRLLREARAEQKRVTAGKNRIVNNVQRISTYAAKPTVKNHLSPALMEQANRLFSVLSLEGDTSETRIRTLNNSLENMARAMERERNAANRATNSVNGTEEHLMMVDPLLSQDITAFIETLGESGKAYISDMNSSEIAYLGELIGRISYSITETDKLRYRSKSVFDLTKASWGEMEKRGKTFAGKLYRSAKIEKLNNGKRRNNPMSSLLISNAEPSTIATLIGGEAGVLINNVVEAEADWARTISETATFFDGLRQKYKKQFGSNIVSTLENKLHTIKTQAGEVTVSSADLMYLAVVSKQEDAIRRITGDNTGITGGLEFINKKRSSVSGKGESTGVLRISNSDLQDMISLLSPAELQLANEIQQFTATYLSDVGNATTLEAYGYRPFTDENYFPLLTSMESGVKEQGTNITSNGANVQEASIANLGFTKARTKNVTAMRTDSIFSVFLQHARDMARYGAYLNPVTDLKKWFNFREDAGTHVNSTKNTIRQAFGSGVEDYIQRFINYAERGNMQPIMDGGWNAFVRRAVGSNVGANFSVILKQPTAIFRAFTELNPKYAPKGLMDSFTKAIAGDKTTGQRLIKYAQERNTLAMAKSLGYGDGARATGLRQSVLGDGTFTDKITDIGSIPANFMDDVTWAVMYQIAENQAKAEFRETYGRAPTDFELQLATNTLYDRAIINTQNSSLPMTRALNVMEGTAAANFTTYMNEGIKSTNMLMRKAITAMIEGDYKGVVGAVMANIANVILTELISGFASAARDKYPYGEEGEKRTLGQRTIDNWQDGLLQEVIATGVFNLGNIPVISQIYDVASYGLATLAGEDAYIFQFAGYEMQALNDVISFFDTFGKLSDGKATPFAAIMSGVDALSTLTGLPAEGILEILTLLGIATANGLGISDVQLMDLYHTPYGARTQYYGKLADQLKRGELSAETLEYVYNNLLSHGLEDWSVTDGFALAVSHALLPEMEKAQAIYQKDGAIAARAYLEDKVIPKYTVKGSTKGEAIATVIIKAFDNYQKSLEPEAEEEEYVEMAGDELLEGLKESGKLFPKEAFEKELQPLVTNATDENIEKINEILGVRYMESTAKDDDGKRQSVRTTLSNFIEREYVTALSTGDEELIASLEKTMNRAKVNGKPLYTQKTRDNLVNRAKTTFREGGEE